MSPFGRPNIQKMVDKQDYKGLVKALGHRDAEVRRVAAWGVGARNRPDVFRALWGISRLTINDPHLSADAKVAGVTEGLKQIRPLADVELLEGLATAARDEDAEVRQAAVTTIGNLGRSRDFARMMVDEWSATDFIAARMIDGLLANFRDLLKPGRETALLVQALSDRQEAIRKEAIAHLAEVGDQRAVEALSSTGEQDPSPEVREAAANAAKQITDSGR